MTFSLLLVSDSLTHLLSLCRFLYNTYAKYNNYNDRCRKFRRKFADGRVPHGIKIFVQVREKFSSNRFHFRPPEHTRKTCDNGGKLDETVFLIRHNSEGIFGDTCRANGRVCGMTTKLNRKKNLLHLHLYKTMWTQIVKQKRILSAGSFRLLTIRLRCISVGVSSQILVLTNLNKTHVNLRSIMTLC